MPAFRTGVVASTSAEHRGLARIVLDDGAQAYALTDLTGPVAPGDQVVVNTTAVDLGLGTGGSHVVHWVHGRQTWSEPGAGHIMKLRYTSLQVDAGAAEEDAELPETLGGAPVVACGLHSQLPVVAAAVAAVDPELRVVYVMTDGAALPLALSDLVARLRSADLLAATVTAGNAFGGDHEAVNEWSGLLVGRHVARADVIVAGIGPGVVGTATRFGHTGLDVVRIARSALDLGGRVFAVTRASDADPRPRHQGVSHHTATAKGLLAGQGVEWPDPDDADELPDAIGVLAHAGIAVRSMGRPLAADPPAWRWAAAAGKAAALAARSAGGQAAHQ